jgi:putative intracellular protease/amidase
VASIDVGAYDAILVAGGQGPMFFFSLECRCGAALLPEACHEGA